MNVLIACEESGTVRDAFIKKGHNAISCDILESSSTFTGPHIQGDVLPLLKYNWDLIIAHPPCTYLANSGVCHLTDKNGDRDQVRWRKMLLAMEFFYKLRDNAYCEKICIENPIPHKYGIGKTYTQIIQPYQFGHPERKATCLWLKGLPKLIPTNDVKELMLTLPKKDQQRIHYLSPGKDRAKLRSKTFQGIADAMADQWTI
jgi:hypothetical protein